MRCVRCDREQQSYICQRCQRVAVLNSEFMKLSHQGKFEEAAKIAEEIICLLDIDEAIKL